MIVIEGLARVIGLGKFFQHVTTLWNRETDLDQSLNQCPHLRDVLTVWVHSPNTSRTSPPLWSLQM
jgi:hypothetical protein